MLEVWGGFAKQGPIGIKPKPDYSRPVTQVRILQHYAGPGTVDFFRFSQFQHAVVSPLRHRTDLSALDLRAAHRGALSCSGQCFGGFRNSSAVVIGGGVALAPPFETPRWTPELHSLAVTGFGPHVKRPRRPSGVWPLDDAFLVIWDLIHAPSPSSKTYPVTPHLPFSCHFTHAVWPPF